MHFIVSENGIREGDRVREREGQNERWQRPRLCLLFQTNQTAITLCLKCVGKYNKYSSREGRRETCKCGTLL